MSLTIISSGDRQGTPSFNSVNAAASARVTSPAGLSRAARIPLRSTGWLNTATSAAAAGGVVARGGRREGPVAVEAVEAVEATRALGRPSGYGKSRKLASPTAEDRETDPQTDSNRFTNRLPLDWVGTTDGCRTRKNDNTRQRLEGLLVGRAVPVRIGSGLQSSRGEQDFKEPEPASDLRTDWFGPYGRVDQECLAK